MTLIRLNVVSCASHSSKKSHAAAHSSRPHLLQPRVKHHFNEPDWLRSPCDYVTSHEMQPLTYLF